MAEQDDHPGSGLRLQRHLQLHHSAEGSLPLQDVSESDHPAAGAKAGCGLSGRPLVLPIGRLFNP